MNPSFQDLLSDSSLLIDKSSFSCNLQLETFSTNFLQNNNNNNTATTKVHTNNNIALNNSAFN